MIEILLATPPKNTGPSPGAGFALFGGGHYGGITNVVDKYKYSNDVVAPGTALANARYYLAGAGNANVGLFAGGNTNIIDKYTYAGDVMQGSVASLAQVQNGPIGLSSPTEARFCGGDGQMQYVTGFFYSNNTTFVGTGMRTARYGGAGVSTSTLGLAACGVGTGGTNIASVDICTFNSDSWAAGTALPVSRAMCAGAGTTDFAIISRDSVGGSNTDKYFYSSNTITTEVALVVPRAYLAAAGDAAVGVIGGGGPTTTDRTDIYTYADNTVAAGTVLGQARYYLAATNSPTTGYFGGGYTTVNVATTDKYVFGTNARTAGTALGTPRNAHNACGDQSVGIFGAGYQNAYVSNTDRYTYSGDVRVAGTSFTTAKYGYGAVSTTPGGF